MPKKLHLLATLLLLSLFSLAQNYSHENIAFLGRWDDTAIAGSQGGVGNRYSGIWGYTQQGREYALVGASDGAHIIDITNAQNPVQVAFVRGRRVNCIWREYKTYSHYLYTVSDDNTPNSLQIIDLSPLPDSVYVVYDDTDLFVRSHTIYVDGDKLYSGITTINNTTQYAMSVYSLANPEHPVLLRRLEDDYPGLVGQVHDMFVQNDTIYASCGYAGLYVFNLDTANHFHMLGSLEQYNFQGYNHSSCLVSNDKYLVMLDEVPSGLPGKVVKLNSISDMQLIDTFSTQTKATPHNPFLCINNRVAVAYYEDGLQVYDFTHPDSAVRSGYFDTHYQTPIDSANGNYAGAWGAYTKLPSRHIIVNDMQNGLFVLDADSALGYVDTPSVVRSLPDNKNISIFPNPVTDKLYLQASESISQIQLWDITGKRVINIIQPQHEIELSGLSNGYYMAGLTISGRVYYRKIMKD